jgi:hypothetical protein
MIHFATVHFRSTAWIGIQREYLDRWVREPFMVWAAVEGIPDADGWGFDVVVPTRKMHADKLNLLGHMIVDRVRDDDDVLIFIDSDAFPVAELMPMVRRELEDSYLVAVQRRENLGDPQPHPLFCATTVGRWRDLRGDWGGAYTWRNVFGQETADVGGNLLYLLESRGLRWTPLLRSNVVDPHPVLFGVYGGVIYHHGAGSRRPATRLDKVEMPWSSASNPLVRGVRNGSVAVRRWRRIRKINRDGERILAELRRDPGFFRALVGEREGGVVGVGR